MSRRRTRNISRMAVAPDLATLCGGVRVVVSEMHGMAAGGIVAVGRHRRRSLCHVRQIAMYVCHVVLQLSMTDIADAYGRDRTTVGHACKVIEDLRDDRAYDEFVSSIERVIEAVFELKGRVADGRK